MRSLLVFSCLQHHPRTRHVATAGERRATIGAAAVQRAAWKWPTKTGKWLKGASRRHRLRALIGFAGGVRGTPALQGRPRVPKAAHVGAVGVRGVGVRERRRVRRARAGARRRQGREREVATMHGDAGPWG